MYVNVFAILGLRYIAGIKVNPIRLVLEWREDLSPTGKKTLDEFGFWSKLPYLAFIGILFYLVIFSSTTTLVLAIGGRSQYVGFFSDDTARWQELELHDSVATLAAFHPEAEGELDDLDLADLGAFEVALLRQYRASSPELYRAWLGDQSDRALDTAAFFYQAVILLFLVLLIAGVVGVWKRRRRLTLVGFLRYSALLALCAFLVLPLRYRAEAITDERTYQRINFLVSQLRIDTNRQQFVDNDLEALNDRIDVL